MRKNKAMYRAGQMPFLKRILSLCALTIGLAVALPWPLAYADEDPFELDSSHWMSFDHYKDAAKRGVIAPSASPAAETADSPSPAAPPAAAPAPVAAIAAPMRPLDLPPMPGLNKGFQVHVSSTEDDTNATATAAPVVSPNAPADIHLSDKNWQDPTLVTRYKRGAQDENAENTPLDIRMSYLPDSKITPVPSPDHMSAQKQARIAVAERLMAKKQQDKAAEPAACAALDAYKKQQLDAIQSDRQTLKALQDAIATLGLQKQLGFMAGTDSSLNANTANAQSLPASIDIPASTSVR